MNIISFRIIFIGLFFIFAPFNQNPAFSGEAEKSPGVPVKLAADYVHAVIEAGRRVYSENVVDRLDKTSSLKATENWEDEDTLLLPAQFLAHSSKLSNKRGVGMRYRLKSLWAINKNNSPISEEEKVGLQEVVKNPKKPFTWLVQKNGRWYFESIYPDIAVADTCVSCHNSHPQSPKTDFKLGDVMGAIIIDFPLGRTTTGKSTENLFLTPEVVGDYVHSVLESDRAVYSKNIVDRLENKNIIQAKEKWLDENALMLPAQFLLYTARLIHKSRLGLDFHLISLWAINSQNEPENEFERIGLETIDIHPIRPFAAYPIVGKKRFYQSVYPDFATTTGCVDCHNSHSKSPKRDFQLGDVMGGIVVTFPLN